jgi:dissimilatory sulfite reductase related protein
MAIIESVGVRIEVNEEGFMARPDEWSREIAVILAREKEGLGDMTPEHWAVVDYIRNHFVVNGQAPMVRKICQATGLPLRRIFELFPSGPAKGACMVAGLPKPDGCV